MRGSIFDWAVIKLRKLSNFICIWRLGRYSYWILFIKARSTRILFVPWFEPFSVSWKVCAKQLRKFIIEKEPQKFSKALGKGRIRISLWTTLVHCWKEIPTFTQPRKPKTFEPDCLLLSEKWSGIGILWYKRYHVIVPKSLYVNKRINLSGKKNA